MHPSLAPQADVIIDETYTATPLAYDAAALLKDWGLTEAEAASVPAIANKQVGRGGWMGWGGVGCFLPDANGQM